MKSTARNVVVTLIGVGIVGASLYAITQGITDDPAASDDDVIEITVEVPEEEEPEVEPTDELADAEDALDQIEQHLDAKLFARLQRNGRVNVQGIKMTMEHRAEIFLRLSEDGTFLEKVEGKGRSINAVPPYALDVCNYDVLLDVHGALMYDDCILRLQVNEVVMDGECTHWDPNTTFPYEYIGSHTYKENVDVFVLSGVLGTSTYKSQSVELLGITEWNDTLEVWIIDHIPHCLPEGFPPDQVPTPIPWPTPTWQAN